MMDVSCISYLFTTFDDSCLTGIYALFYFHFRSLSSSSSPCPRTSSVPLHSLGLSEVGVDMVDGLASDNSLSCLRRIFPAALFASKSKLTPVSGHRSNEPEYAKL